MNPVIYFDELDKISASPKGDEIANLLCHLTDTSQNTQFHDKFFSGVDFDLSKATFIFSYNDEKKVNPILLDRMIKIYTKGFNTKDKLEIANKYLIPNICKEIGFNIQDVIFTKDILTKIIVNFTEEEKGVRNLKRCIETIVSKLNVLKLLNNTLTTLENNNNTIISINNQDVNDVKNTDSITLNINTSLPCVDNVKSNSETMKLTNNNLLDSTLENNNSEDNKLEDSKSEDNKLEDSKLEDSKLEDSKLEDNKLENSKLEDSKLEDNKLEDSKLEDSKLEDRKKNACSIYISNMVKNIIKNAMKLIEEKSYKITLQEKASIVKFDIKNFKLPIKVTDNIINR